MPAYLVTGDATTNIKVALNLTTTQFAICTASIFTLTNGFFQLIYGQLADTASYRKWILLVCTVCFCMSVFLMSFMQGFWGFFFGRLLFSLFMASNVPLSVSLLCDYTDPHERGRAQSLYAAGMYLGVGFSSLSILLDEAIG